MSDICQTFMEGLSHLDGFKDLDELVLGVLEVHGLAGSGDQPEGFGAFVYSGDAGVGLIAVELIVSKGKQAVD